MPCAQVEFVAKSPNISCHLTKSTKYPGRLRKNWRCGLPRGFAISYAALMHTQRFVTPLTVGEALRFIEADPGAAILAGGTDLLVQYQGGTRRPSAFVDVKRIPELMRIAADADGVTIGAAVPAADIAGHPAVRSWWPGLVEAVSLIGSTQIQSRCSLGGNLCNASPAADSTCSLIVNNALAIIAGANGERQVPVERFATAPGKTTLETGDLEVIQRRR